MARKGFSHVGLSTLDMDRTRAFYEGVLGFKAVRCDTMQVKEGGQIRHVFVDAGDRQLPERLLREYACWTRELADDDARMQARSTVSLRGPSPVTDFRDR